MIFPTPRRTMTAGDNSVEIAYDVRGHGPVVLCIQGVGVIGRGWQPQADALAGHFRIITFDNRGVERLHELRCMPTLVVCAAHDPIAPPRLSKAIADGISGARFVEFPHEL